jgi:hypothetical protein
MVTYVYKHNKRATSIRHHLQALVRAIKEPRQKGNVSVFVHSMRCHKTEDNHADVGSDGAWVEV